MSIFFRQTLSSDYLVSYITGRKVLLYLLYTKKTSHDLLLHFPNIICTPFLKSELFYPPIGILLIHNSLLCKCSCSLIRLLSPQHLQPLQLLGTSCDSSWVTVTVLYWELFVRLAHYRNLSLLIINQPRFKKH